MNDIVNGGAVSVTTVAVYHEPVAPENMAYRAVARGASATGQTAGEA